MTDTCKNNVSKFVWRTFKYLHYYANKNVLVKHFSLISITSAVTTIYSLKDCSV